MMIIMISAVVMLSLLIVFDSRISFKKKEKSAIEWISTQFGITRSLLDIRILILLREINIVNRRAIGSDI